LYLGRGDEWGYVPMSAAVQNASRKYQYFSYEASFLSLILAKYYSGDQTKKNELGAACGTCEGRGEQVLTGCWWGILRKRNPFTYLRVDGKEILKWILNGLDVSGSGQEQVAVFCECGNKPPGFIKC
jgi:hypothetical protein